MYQDGRVIFGEGEGLACEDSWRVMDERGV